MTETMNATHRDAPAPQPDAEPARGGSVSLRSLVAAHLADCGDCRSAWELVTAGRGTIAPEERVSRSVALISYLHPAATGADPGEQVLAAIQRSLP